MLIINIKDMRALPSNSLEGKLKELQLELAIEKRKVAATGVASKMVKTREIRRTIARIMTIINEKKGAQK